ncbi:MULTISPECIES: hypothetical protein [unclassified Aureimonas]|uniref:hypothetical protein n=1 Tax=unclassified Aureimonas TaxID=2615206 RepID=UPI000ADE1B3E|nr:MULTISPECIES: hypothetical protein [unclassified Aureimonas]
MIARLTVVATLFALFAVSMAGLVESTRPSHASFAPSGTSCLDQGLVCAGR